MIKLSFLFLSELLECSPIDCIPCYIGLALQFLTKVFQSWVKEKDFANLSSSLRKAELENKLLVS